MYFLLNFNEKLRFQDHCLFPQGCISSLTETNIDDRAAKIVCCLVLLLVSVTQIMSTMSLM